MESRTSRAAHDADLRGAADQTDATNGASSFSRRRFLAVAGAGGLIAGVSPLLAACGKGKGAQNSSSANKDLVVLTPYTVDAPTLAIWNSVAQPMGLTIKLQTVTDADFASQAAARQQAGNSPDLYFQTSGTGASLARLGVSVEALDSLASAENKDLYYPADYTSGQYNGKLLGLGVDAGCRGIAYRGDYAEAAGLSAPPKSWHVDEFGAWISKLQSGKYNGFAFEAKTNDGRGPSNVLPLIWSTGGHLLTQEGGKWKLGATQDQLTSVLKFYRDTVYTWKCTPKDVAGYGYNETDTGFAKGSLAAYSTGPFVKSVCAKYPQTLKNIKIASLPYFDKPANFWESHGFAVSSTSKKKDQALKFLAGLRSQAVQKKLVALPAASLSVCKSLNAVIKDPVNRTFGLQLDSSLALPEEQVDYLSVFNAAVFPAIQSVTLKGTDPAAAAQALMKNSVDPITKINNT